MEEFLMDNLASALAAMAALVVAYGGWLCVHDVVTACVDLSAMRRRPDKAEDEPKRKIA